MHRKFQVGCPCCGCQTIPLPLLDDTFSSDTSASYDIVSGTWTIGSGYAQTGDSNAILIWDTDLNASHSISVKIQRPSVPPIVDYFRLIVAYADSDNYLYAQLRVYWSGVTARIAVSLWQRESGVETELRAEEVINVAIDNNSVFPVALCWRPGQGDYYDAYSSGGNLSFTNGEIHLGGVSGFDVDVNIASFLGVRAGIGTGTLGSDAVNYDRLMIYDGCDGCFHCFCQTCKDGTTPNSITLEFSGVANGACSSCDDWNNAAFVIDREGNTCNFVEQNIDDVIDCGDSEATPAEPYYRQIRCYLLCAGHAGLVLNWTNDGLTFRVDIERAGAGGTPPIPAKRVRWEWTADCCKIDCASELAGKSLTLVPTDGSWAEDDACDWSNASLTITAVT